MTSPSVSSPRMLMVATLGAAVLLGHAEPAHAQDSGDSIRAFLLYGVHYGAPERLFGSLSVVFPFGKADSGVSGKALELRGSAGRGGYGVAFGPRLLNYGPFGPEALVTLRRTFSSPRRASGQSTYVGVEVGYQLLGRVSIGIARQIDGPSAMRDTRLTWNVGLQMPTCMWRWPTGC